MPRSSLQGKKKKKKNKTVFRSLWYVDMLQWLTFNKSSCWYILHNPFPPFMDDCKMKPCLWILSENDCSIGKTLIRRRLFMTLLAAEEKQKRHLASKRSSVANASIFNNIYWEMYILAKKNVKCFHFCLFVQAWRSLFNYLLQPFICQKWGAGQGSRHMGKSYFKK